MIEQNSPSINSNVPTHSADCVVNNTAAVLLHERMYLISSRGNDSACQTPLNELFDEVAKITDVTLLRDEMNSPVPFDNERDRIQVASHHLKKLLN